MKLGPRRQRGPSQDRHRLHRSAGPSGKFRETRCHPAARAIARAARDRSSWPTHVSQSTGVGPSTGPSHHTVYSFPRDTGHLQKMGHESQGRGTWTHVLCSHAMVQVGHGRQCQRQHLSQMLALGTFGAGVWWFAVSPVGADALVDRAVHVVGLRQAAWGQAGRSPHRPASHLVISWPGPRLRAPGTGR